MRISKIGFLSLALLAIGLVAQPARATEALMQPDKLNEQAPDSYKVEMETSKGSFVVEVQRDWAPLGADRFYNLVKSGFYNDVRFFRVVPNFVVQFGLNGDPGVNQVWREARIKDDAVKKSNSKGMLCFATAGPNTRTTQVFINLKSNAGLDNQGFAPFGEVVEGMDVVEKLHSGYGDRGPNQHKIVTEGNAYLDAGFGELDKLVKATLVGGSGGAKAESAGE